ncbi:ABC transporter ATP-binding protein [Flexivirga meconopsidis]|uniref:ABC transporter ATP-binding protein n=1 Tax=Flexivirga meconopsidis TaxID=2977121 RepID=UPI0022401D3A|nr:ABC transporter ATP-binding protein [Flexivirga meconopsidis]
MTTTLQLHNITKELGGNRVVSDLSLDVAAGELVCLLGASGCGKTTTLRMIGGFLTPDSGRIVIDDEDHTATPPEHRPTAMVFQNYALWPHMTVAQNVGYGLRLRGMTKREVATRVAHLLETVGLSHRADSKPVAISGGEQQRTALARALVLEPSVLLLDEPLSNLDAKLRVRVREQIRALQQRTGTTMVFVTHDQEEALALADRIAVMNAGRIEQFDTADAVYRHPATEFVARFVGTMNLLDCTLTPGSAKLDDGTLLPVTGPVEPMSSSGATGRVRLAIRPEDVRLDDPDGTPATVIRQVPLGHYREVVLGVGGVELRAFTGAATATPPTVMVSASRAVGYPLAPA